VLSNYNVKRMIIANDYAWLLACCFQGRHFCVGTRF
jgi:hypothetical protein